MVQYVGFIFLVFCAVVLVVFGATLVGHIATSGFFPNLSSGFGPVSSGGLSVVDFSFFAKNGNGWSAITQGYGSTADAYLYINHWHNGIDIAARYGAPIYSPVINGVVLAIGNQDNYCPSRGFGKFVVVQDNTNHLDLLFAHLGTIAVSPGATVAKDAALGTIGASGLETGPHLHFSVFKSADFTVTPAHGCGPYPEGHDVNPVPYLGTTYN
jgi:murein DD-endopeptidase MepM/ murein hydrolase activator NlpD